MFVNISKHPNHTWSAKQRVAAEALGGRVVDEAFPEVPPEASESAVAAIGRALAGKVAALAPEAAMIQGEFSLAFFLVCELQSKGIPCYAATTRRLVESKALADGTTEKVSRFEFVRFRRYAAGRETS